MTHLFNAERDLIENMEEARSHQVWKLKIDGYGRCLECRLRRDQVWKWHLKFLSQKWATRKNLLNRHNIQTKEMHTPSSLLRRLCFCDWQSGSNYVCCFLPLLLSSQSLLCFSFLDLTQINSGPTFLLQEWLGRHKPLELENKKLLHENLEIKVLWVHIGFQNFLRRLQEMNSDILMQGRISLVDNIFRISVYC